MRFILVSLPAILPLALGAPEGLLERARLEDRQNTGCYCGTLTSRSTLYNCTQRFGNAQVKSRCLICNAGEQDGYGSCYWGWDF
ncbi:hypothetical protein B0J14DRAFT_588188, partial [Halenospora varia]